MLVSRLRPTPESRNERAALAYSYRGVHRTLFCCSPSRATQKIGRGAMDWVGIVATPHSRSDGQKRVFRAICNWLRRSTGALSHCSSFDCFPPGLTLHECSRPPAAPLPQFQRDSTQASLFPRSAGATTCVASNEGSRAPFGVYRLPFVDMWLVSSRSIDCLADRRLRYDAGHRLHDFPFGDGQ
jgi:hypothetical protein